MDIYDLVAAVGIGLIGVGCWLISPALALVVVGSLLVGVGVAGARAGGQQEQEGGR